MTKQTIVGWKIVNVMTTSIVQTMNYGNFGPGLVPGWFSQISVGFHCRFFHSSFL